MNRVLLDQVRSELDDVDAALQRLQVGTYGQCEACGGPICRERLEVVPAARYCLDHQPVAEGADPSAPGMGRR